METIDQKTKGNGNEVIGIQNNYQGLTPEEATNIALKLFYDNFPKLQEDAKKVVDERTKTFLDALMATLDKKGIKDFSSFAEPDMQCALYDATRNYAKYGTEELLSTLSALLAERTSEEKDLKIKVIIDEAINVTAKLSTNDINYLSMIFLCKDVLFEFNEPKKEQLVALINTAFSKMPFTKNETDYLFSLGCLKIQLGQVPDRFKDAYGFVVDKSEVPSALSLLPGDYSASCIGAVLAITNIQQKLGIPFNIKNWVN